MKCEVCRGACCETWAVPVRELNPQGIDSLLWILLHGQRRQAVPEAPSLLDDFIQFECKCLALDENGACSIYTDPKRPQLCASFERGGSSCLTAVSDRRTPEQYQEIRDDEDPLVLKSATKPG